MPTITLYDETTTGSSTPALTLDILTERITVRELIRSRVYQEVQDYNSNQAAHTFKGLVQPTDAERTLNGSEFKIKTRRQIDWKDQFQNACDAFAKNRILILVDTRQAESLDEEITLHHDTRVSFLKLVPLVGG